MSALVFSYLGCCLNIISGFVDVCGVALFM